MRLRMLPLLLFATGVMSVDQMAFAKTEALSQQQTASPSIDGDCFYKRASEKLIEAKKTLNTINGNLAAFSKQNMNGTRDQQVPTVLSLASVIQHATREIDFITVVAYLRATEVLTDNGKELSDRTIGKSLVALESMYEMIQMFTGYIRESYVVNEGRSAVISIDAVFDSVRPCA